MSWDLTIRRIDGKPLGQKADVVEAISKAVPAFVWEDQESQLLQAVQDPNHPLAKLLTDEDRQRLSKPKLNGAYGSDDVSIEVYGFEEDPLCSVEVEVRGNGDPLPILSVICAPNEWVVVETATGKILELTDASPWERFQRFRADALREILGEDEEI